MFGEDNFVSTFKWNKTATPPFLSKKVRIKYEYINCYEKNKTNIEYNGGITECGYMPLLNESNVIRKIRFNPTDNYMSEEDYEWFSLRYLNNEKNIGKFKLQEILEMNNVVVDTRMSDLRLYHNRMPTLRAHRDGIYYVRDKKIYYLKGEEALKFQGFDDCFIKRVSGKVSNRHLLQQAGNAMTANVVQSIGKAILDRLEEV